MLEIFYQLFLKYGIYLTKVKLCLIYLKSQLVFLVELKFLQPQSYSKENISVSN